VANLLPLVSKKKISKKKKNITGSLQAKKLVPQSGEA
jgi:hypothetical protein